MPSAPTTNIVEVRAVRDNVVFLKDGTVRALIDVAAVNFELRSHDEQVAMLQNFQSFLNSLDFPIQIVVQSRRYNIESYLALVSQATEALENDLLKLQAQEYGRFIRELATLSNIMSKKFYVVVSLTAPGAIAATKQDGGFLGGLRGMFGKGKAQPAQEMSDTEFTALKLQLDQRVGLISDALASVGLKTSVLAGEQLERLFVETYSPEVPLTTPA